MTWQLIALDTDPHPIILRETVFIVKILLPIFVQAEQSQKAEMHTFQRVTGSLLAQAGLRPFPALKKSSVSSSSYSSILIITVLGKNANTLPSQPA